MEDRLQPLLELGEAGTLGKDLPRVTELNEQLSRPDLLSRFAETFTKRFDQVVRGTDGELRDLDRQIERASARVKNVTAAIAAAGFLEAVLAQLKVEEGAVAALRARTSGRRRT